MRKDYTISELLATEVSRHLPNGEMGFIGVGTGGEAFIMAVGIPAVASRLAQLRRAPDYTVMFGPIIDPFLDAEHLPSSTNEFDLIRWKCRSQIPVEDALNIFKRGLMGVGFVSAAQIDQYGNLNISQINNPNIRLPGALAQTDHQAYAKQTIVLMKHSVRTFVQKVDYITGQGHEKREGLTGGGPSLVVTDLGVMDFDPLTKKLRLKSIHPGKSVEEIISKTGFELSIPKDVTVTQPPSIEDLNLIRLRIDPDRKFLEARMSLVPASLDS
ncbi:hypothetical protein M3212_15330 [Alkalihalobacillus oceani]|uniref:CoA-transferase subunit beta n=1 Tax=Halalkalibacter oceani TaxID=1653776 RepID=UPI00203E17E4|nr:CoA-transferase [Halalkalibacter oceani]MCM3762143.1 hypothetical protein [Halalkalibacter oceani]